MRPAHVLPRDSADPADVAADLVIQDTPDGGAVNSRGDELTEDRLIRGDRIRVKVLRIVARGEFNQLFRRDRPRTGLARFADNDVVEVAARLCHYERLTPRTMIPS